MRKGDKLWIEGLTPENPVMRERLTNARDKEVTPPVQHEYCLIYDTISERRIIEHRKLPSVESANFALSNAELLNIKSYRTWNRQKSN